MQEVPKDEQLRFLKSMASSTQSEAMPRHCGHNSDPQALALLARPGTGKTKCIKLACQYFKEVCCWNSGVEFQCLASQNRMAGRIDGATIHSWGEVPNDRDNVQARERKTSKHSGGSEMHNKAARLRWLIIDEISTASLYVVCVLEKHVTLARQGQPRLLSPQMVSPGHGVV